MTDSDGAVEGTLPQVVPRAEGRALRVTKDERADAVTKRWTPATGRDRDRLPSRPQKSEGDRT